MSRHPILTLSGMYQYDNTIFDGMTLPDELDPEHMKTTILDQCGNNEVRYPNPDILKTMIENFFYTNVYMMKTLVGTITQEYSPIENYDRYEDTTRNLKGTNDITASDHPGMITEETVSAFDSESYEPSRKTQTSGQNSTENHSSSDSEDTYTAHMHGNIGVTTNQQMLEAERQIAMFSVYKEIALHFENEITIPVY